MNTRIIVIYCGILMTLGAASIDIVLPAFSIIASDLNAPYLDAQRTVTLFILANGVGQIFVGSLSDRWGRRPVIICGLLIFVAGTIAGQFAATIEQLHLARITQGLGAAVAPVIGRAVMRDLFSGDELARNLALTTALFALGPIVAPLVGAVLLLYFSWQSLFGWMLFFGSALLLFAVFQLEETIPAKDGAATSPKTIFSHIRLILSKPTSMYFLGTGIMIYLLILIILSSLPRVFDETFSITGSQFAVLFALHGFGIIAGQIANRHMISKIGAGRTAQRGAFVLVLSCVLLTAGAAFELIGPYITVAIIILFATSHLIVFSNLIALYLSEHGGRAGFASSFWGFFTQVAGSAIAMFTAGYIAGDFFRLATTLLAISTIALACLSLQKHVVPDHG